MPPSENRVGCDGILPGSRGVNSSQEFRPQRLRSQYSQRPHGTPTPQEEVFQPGVLPVPRDVPHLFGPGDASHQQALQHDASTVPRRDRLEVDDMLGEFPSPDAIGGRGCTI